MPTTSPIVIVLNADDEFAMPLAVTLYSALLNLQSIRDVLIYIIDGGISEQNRQKITEVLNVKNVAVQLEWVKPDTSILSGLKTTRWHNETAYFRLLAPELLPKQLEKVIYLDSDLVLESDLGQLWQEEVGDYAALAVQDYASPFVSSAHLSETYQLLGLAPETPYFNTGVMAINLKWWRAKNIGPKVLDYVREFDQFIRFPDQDGLNAIVAGNWKLLDPKWNVILSALERYGRFHNMSKVEIQQMQEELCRRPFILHFTGPLKPWHFLYSTQARSRFFYYLQKSEWFGAIEAIDDLMKTAWQYQNRYDKFMEQLYTAKQELDELIPAPAERFILVNQDQWPLEFTEDRHAIPFLERDGKYWGTPPDDETAVREFERLHQAGAKFMVFGWPAFWWLDYYHKLSHHLYSAFPCVLQNERLIVFDLRA